MQGGKSNEIYILCSSASDVPVLVSNRGITCPRYWTALDDWLSYSLHRASALYASALREMGALATIVSGAMSIEKAEANEQRYIFIW